MKSNKLISIIIILLLTACNEMLIEEPRDIMDPAQFFNTDDELISVVNGIYSRGVFYIFNAGDGTNNYGYISHWGTDIARPTGGREPNFAPHVYTFSSSEDGNIRASWQTFYRTIADANVVISKAEENKDNFSAEVYDQSVGQAKFLRAQFYYILTNYWGDVPMWLDELNINEVVELPRTPVADIYNQMITDLTDASSKLPSIWEGANKGRASKWAAMMLLTKVYMLQGDWNKAKAAAGSIINDSPHTLMPEYGNIFGIENEYNNEIIWEADFQQDINRSNRPSRFTPRGVDEPKFGPTEIDYIFQGFGLLTSTNEFIASFDPDDQRIPFYNLNGVYDDPDGDGVYDNWVQFKFRYVEKNIDHGSPRGNSGLNSIIYRLADAYLMYAEAENEINGPTADAYAKINAIRDRAFGDNPEKRLSGLTKEEFRNAIMDERKWELAFEYHRRWDLKRWGKLGEAVQSIAKTNPLGAQNFRPYHVLFPIPFQEIDLNPNLTQNDGY
jgi:starch-binding outer membrane protein, SusD/RagB family